MKKDTLTLETDGPLLGRREFTLQSALAILGAATITVVGCGSSGGGGTTPTSPTPGTGTGSGRSGTVTANHGHSAEISSAQLTAANAISLDIRGSANHPHTVELTATEVGQIGQGQRVSKESSNNDAHTHTVIFN